LNAIHWLQSDVDVENRLRHDLIVKPEFRLVNHVL
jgi:hypothetical protein